MLERAQALSLISNTVAPPTGTYRKNRDGGRDQQHEGKTAVVTAYAQQNTWDSREGQHASNIAAQGSPNSHNNGSGGWGNKLKQITNKLKLNSIAKLFCGG